MKITNLQIERFGAWNELRLEQLPQGLVVFFGRNEAGKTTVLQFLRSMFFGYQNEEIRSYLHPLGTSSSVFQAGMRGGGSMSLVAGGVEYHLRRLAKLADANDSQGDVRLTAQHGERVGAHRLQTLLAGVDEHLFNNVFAVGLREMQQLATLNETEAAQQLYSLSTGTDRVSLVDIMRQLQGVRQRLIGSAGLSEESYLGQLLQQGKKLHRQFQDVTGSRNRWVQLRQQAQAVEAEMKRVIEQQRDLSTSITRLDAATRLHDQWQQREFLRTRLEAAGSTTAVPSHVLEELDQMVAEGESAVATLQSVTTRLTASAQEKAKFEQQLPGARDRLRVEQIVEQKAAIEQLCERRDALLKERGDMEAEIQLEQEKLGIEPGGKGRSIIDPRQLFSLLEPARQFERDRDQYEQAAGEISRQKEELDKVERELLAGLKHEPGLFDEQDAKDVVAAVQKTGHIAAGLRKQIAAQRRIASLREEFTQVRQMRADAYRNQLLPREIIIGLGVVFTVGAFLCLFSFFGNWFFLSTTARFGYGVMGGIAMAVASFLKVFLEQSTRDVFRRLQSREARIQQEIATLATVPGASSAKLFAGREPSNTLAAAEKRLKCLEQLLPLESRRRNARHRLSRCQQVANYAKQRHQQSTAAWEEALKQSGMSLKLAPSQLRELVNDSARLGRLQQRYRDCITEVDSVNREWESWRHRLVAYHQHTKSESKKLTDIVEELSQQVARWDQIQSQWTRVREEVDRLRHEQLRHQDHVRQLEGRQRDLLLSLGARDVMEIRDRVRQYQEITTWKDQLDLLDREIQSRLGTHTEADLLPYLQERSLDDLQTAQKSLQGQHEEIEQRLKELRFRSHETTNQLQHVAQDSQWAKLRLQESIVRQRLQDALQHWRVVTAMSELLQSVYKKYEKERQPDTLRDASQYFQRMSENRYLRIWSPLAEDILLADAADGRTIPVQQMSSGAREQVYLSLRLALVASYARRGIQMPVILDDVLVNFDEERTRAAAEVLVEFAQRGHQVFVFTCHRHVTAIFRGLNVEVRELPQRDAPSTSQPQPKSGAAASKRPRPIRRRRLTTSLPLLGFAEPRSRRRRRPAMALARAS